MRKLRTIEMNRLSVDEFKSSEKMPLVVVLDDVRSLYNVGSVFRTCDAFRVEALYLCGITATPPNAEIHKTALGGEDSVEWKYFSSAGEAVADLRRRNYTVYSVEQAEGSTMLQDLEIIPAGEVFNHETAPRRYAVILGNEVKGVRQSVIDLSDDCLEIPQFGTKHSMNVAVTAGIIIWHFAQQLMLKK